MGSWHTIHLFNDKIFYNETVPLLKGDKGDLLPYYQKFLNTCTSGVCETSMEEMISIFNQMENDFRIFPAFQQYYMKDLGPFYDEYRWTYAYSAFFEQVVFRDCADYRPYYMLGKNSLKLKFSISLTKASNHIIGVLGEQNFSSVFCAEGFGITGWASSEEVKLVSSDLDNALAAGTNLSEHDLDFLTDFSNFLRVAARLNLGMIAGVDMREDTLSTLPQFKFSDEALWKDENIERLGFE